MFRPSFALPFLLAGSLAAGDAAPAGPWRETLAMTVRGAERAFAVMPQGAFLISDRAEVVAQRAVLAGQDLAWIAKLRRIEGDRFGLYRPAEVALRDPRGLLRGRVDQENVWLFGSLSGRADGGQEFTVAAAADAPSDLQRLAARIGGAAEGNWEKRIASGQWAREQAEPEGNREFWLTQGDNLILQVVGDAAAKAEKARDPALLLKAMDWSIDLLNDPGRAARLGSVAWVREVGGEGAETIAKKLRRLGMEFYGGLWRPRGEALSLQFEDRFAETPWRDAEAFYRLGRWADQNAELLPRAKDCAYRAYQAGFKADPTHGGIRRELGLEVAAAGGEAPKTAVRKGGADYRNDGEGVTVPAPTGWKGVERQAGTAATWIDPASETATISLTVAANGSEFEAVWEALTAPLTQKPGFTWATAENASVGQGQTRLQQCHWSDGAWTRTATVGLVWTANARSTALLVATYGAEEQGKVEDALRAAMAGTVLIGAPGPAQSASAPAP